VARNNIDVVVKGDYQDKDINRAISDLKRLQASSLSMGGKMQAVGGQLQGMGRSVAGVGKSLTLGLTLPIVGLGTAAVASAIAFESAFAGVRKTVDATEAEFADLERGIRDMSMRLPASAEAIAGVGEAAGQLGIKTSNILKFSETMINLGEATNLSAEEAATSLARLANITQMPQTEFDKLGSSVVALGNNLATTEAEIVEMGLRIAGAGNQIGLTQAEILGFAGALSSVGIEAAAGGSSISKVMLSIQQSVLSGGKKLEGFAKIAGVSASEFARQFSEAPSQAMVTFVEGLQRIEAEGGNVVGALEDVGFKELRVRDALLRLTGAGDLLSQSLGISTEAWQKNTALATEAEQRYGTTASQLQMLKNQIAEAARSLGEALIPVLLSSMEVIKPFVARIVELAQSFQNMSPAAQQFIITAGAIAAAIGPVLLIAGKLIIVAGTIVQELGKITLVGSILAVKIVAVVAAIALVVLAFKAAYDNSAPLRAAIGDLMRSLENLGRSIINAVLAPFRVLSGEGKGLGDIFKTVAQVLGGVLATAVNYVSGVAKILAGAFQVLGKAAEIVTTLVRMAANVIRGLLIVAFDVLLNKLGPISTALRAVAGGVRTAFSSIANIISGAFRGVTGAVESVINFAIDGINMLIRAYNKLADFLPGVSRATEIAAFKFQGLASATADVSKGAAMAASTTDGWATSAGRATMAAGASVGVNNAAAESFKGVAGAASGAGNAAKGAGSAAKDAADKTKEAADKFKTQYAEINDALTKAVDDIKTKMADMATSVSSSLMRGFQFGDAAEEVGADGELIGGTFIEKLQAQANKVTGFAQKIKDLMALGLDVNSPLMKAVIAEGATPSGIAIAQSLIDGGADTINQATEILTAAQGAADEIGTLAAENFYGAGLAGAEETVKAFVDNFGVKGKGRTRLMTLMDNLAASMKRETTITVTTINKVLTQAVDGARAMGGPVAAGKAYLVGERGPEVVVMGQQSGYVVPNHSLSMTGGGPAGVGGTNINLTVNAGMGTSGAEVGRQIVDALKAYERRNGSVYVAA